MVEKILFVWGVRGAIMHRLIVKDLAKEFVTAHIRTQILQHISVEFSQGTSYAITGASGVGKSTFIHLLAGLDKPTHGCILFDDVDIATYNESMQSQYLQKSVGLLFQLPYLLRELTVLENIMLPAMTLEENKSAIRDRAKYLLSRVGLHEKINEFPKTLSMGQQQRVALCRSVMNQPSFLLADEPTGALDEQTGRIIINLLLEICEQFHMGLIVSTHDMRLAREMKVVYEMVHKQLTQKHF